MQPYLLHSLVFFFFNDTATTEIYTLSLHDALPISINLPCTPDQVGGRMTRAMHPRTLSLFADLVALVLDRRIAITNTGLFHRSEEHTSELQSRQYLVCRLLLEKKKNTYKSNIVAYNATIPSSLSRFFFF